MRDFIGLLRQQLMEERQIIRRKNFGHLSNEAGNLMRISLSEIAVALVGVTVGVVFGLWPSLDLAIAALFYDTA